jgi:mono/diheme cytochrome c family protein
MKHALVLVLAAAILAGCAKNTNTATTASSEPASPAATAAATTVANAANANDGGKVYTTNCASCHQANGQGVEGNFPPLAGNPVVVGDPSTVIHVLKYGLSGKINIKGHEYNGMMPAWGQQLSNGDIAAVVTYIRASWGNSASAVTSADVAAVPQ